MQEEKTYQIEKNKQKPEVAAKQSEYAFLLENNSKQKVIEGFKNTSTGLSTGYRIGEIDDLKIPGGGITIIAAPTGHGKTTMLINIILSILRNNDINAYFFTYEESFAPIISLFINRYIGEYISENNRVAIESFYRGDGEFIKYIKPELAKFFAKKEQEFFKNFIDNGRLRTFYSDTTAEKLVAQIKFIKENTNVGIIGIDYIQLLKTIKGSKISRQEQLKEICLRLKDCAVETGLPIIITAQFNRQVTMESEMSPLLIREAGDIEQIAQLILGLWNRNKRGFNKNGNTDRNGKSIEPEPTMYVEVLKGRKIGDGYCDVLDFNGNTAKISNQPLNPTNNFTHMKQKENKGKSVPIANL